jgi:hypothetical protein
MRLLRTPGDRFVGLPDLAYQPRHADLARVVGR